MGFREVVGRITTTSEAFTCALDDGKTSTVRVPVTRSLVLTPLILTVAVGSSVPE